MNYEFKIGTEIQNVDIPDTYDILSLLPNKVEYTEIGAPLVEKALQNPIGAPMLNEVVKKGDKIALITSDITRPVPSYIILPVILDNLLKCGINKEDVTVVFGMGIHRKHTAEEKKKLVGDYVFENVKCVDSNEGDYVHLGYTSRGTPVDVSRPVAEADKVICVGNVEYHYFAGYSGGAKAIMPGVSTHAAIQNNHKMMVLPECSAGALETNPLRMDIEEAGRICGIDYIVNVVLDEKKQIVHAVAGDATLAHRNACAYLDKLYQKPLESLADIVIVSQGGAPKDLNLYQTQKALDNAKNAVKKGGTIILIGSCIEGYGEDVFENWLNEAEKPEDLTDRISKDFQLGGHKAAAIAMVLANADIYLVSHREAEFAERTFMKPFKTVKDAFECAVNKYSKNAKIILMPCGGSTLPNLR